MAVDANSTLFEALMLVFEEAGVPYCILAGYDGYPDSIPSDVDFMLPADWAARLPALVAAAGARSGAHLVQCIVHETTAAYFALARLEGDRIVWLHPDSSSDFRRGGRLLLRAGRVLARRRRHPRGFWIPAAGDGFAYYLVKKLDKGSLSEAQARQLTARFAEDPVACRAAMRRTLPEAEAAFVEAAAESDDWSAVAGSVARLREAMSRHAARESIDGRLVQRVADLRRVFDRLIHPTGLCIAFLGPDGSGKSSVIARVSAELERGFRHVEYRHLRPPLRPSGSRAGPVQVVVDPHARPPRGLVGSIAKLVAFWATYVLGGLIWLYPCVVRSRLVVFDRYFHDILADPLRYRLPPGGMAWRLARRLARWVPEPDLVLVLDAAPETLQARKQEVPLAESRRQRAAYLRMARDLPCAHVIDAEQPLEQVVGRVLTHVLAAMEARTRERLALDRDLGQEGAVEWKL